MLVISKDNETDLALLEPRNSVPQKLHQKNFGSLRDSDVELGEKLLVSGYPFGDALSSSLKVTTGVVSSTLGLFNNVAQFQMDAAIQPGNSGGPIYDDRGNIVGVVVSRLNKISMLKASGTLPENTNFGIKSSSVLKFVRAAGIEAASSARDKELSSTLISKRAQDETVMLTCKQ
jgi:S1-C subfamily serine protease